MGNLSLQKVISNICTKRFGLSVNDGLFISGAPKMHNISDLSQVGHVHLDR